MKNKALAVCAAGIAVNFLLFATKVYVGIASSSLSVYCDAMNNLGDTFACSVAVMGFALTKKLDEIRSRRAQSLSTFVIGLVIAVTGIYFAYNGAERLFYPLPVAYMDIYAVAIIASLAVKALLALFMHLSNRSIGSAVIRALALDSALDCLITLFVLMSLFLVQRVNFAVDGIFALVCGVIITISAIRNIISQTKYLISGE